MKQKTAPIVPARFPLVRVLEKVRVCVEQFPAPIVTEYSRAKADPYKILISTILSLRTKDETTAAASARIFKLAASPAAMLLLGEETIAQAIFPVGFYRTKARTILEISRRLIDERGGRVPEELEELLTFKGVGRKTANLVMTLGHGKPGICVDTHVHRITNRWGLIRTATPEQTEMALRKILPPRYWIPINDWLVAFGQQICRPVSPMCSQCPVARWCRRVGVTRSR